MKFHHIKTILPRYKYVPSDVLAGAWIRMSAALHHASLLQFCVGTARLHGGHLHSCTDSRQCHNTVTELDDHYGAQWPQCLRMLADSRLCSLSDTRYRRRIESLSGGRCKCVFHSAASSVQWRRTYSPGTSVCEPATVIARLTERRLVYFTSGIIHLTLPNADVAGPNRERGESAEPTDSVWIHGGKYGLILGLDTADVSKDGHVTTYPGAADTVALQIPSSPEGYQALLEKKVVIYPGGCKETELVGF